MPLEYCSQRQDHESWKIGVRWQVLGESPEVVIGALNSRAPPGRIIRSIDLPPNAQQLFQRSSAAGKLKLALRHRKLLDVQ